MYLNIFLINNFSLIEKWFRNFFGDSAMIHQHLATHLIIQDSKIKRLILFTLFPYSYWFNPLVGSAFKSNVKSRMRKSGTGILGFSEDSHDYNGWITSILIGPKNLISRSASPYPLFLSASNSPSPFFFSNKHKITV